MLNGRFLHPDIHTNSDRQLVTQPAPADGEEEEDGKASDEEENESLLLMKEKRNLRKNKARQLRRAKVERRLLKRKSLIRTKKTPHPLLARKGTRDLLK
jgi:hypothetical protein